MLRSIVVAGSVLSSLPGFALAKPADCSLVVEGKTRIEGCCDFSSEKDGSFTAWEGRAFYEDKSPRNGGFWVISDFRRDGVIAYPIENFRAIWDELKKCVEASGNK